MFKSSRPFLSANIWKYRLVFWLGAIFIGLLIATMTLLSEHAAELYRTTSLTYPWFNFVVAPFFSALRSTKISAL
jgi:hypothetical protein